ncbi:hypothetical protein B6U99_01995 [Candidatus Geothermarchaeota archaeon ex4572_27]|nr:MAG: hypothetical protein B6U99_01995 [Candidatus Geothermarchaeota archaeon ex4572_27]
MIEIRERVEASRAMLVAMAAIMTVIVYLFTVIFSLYIPQTKGFFNFGEVGVYIAATIGGPIVGLVAGGVGSALADITLGYAYYAPGTLVIKAVEGLIVGLLYGRLARLKPRRAPVIVLIAAISAAMYAIGSRLYVGRAEVSLGGLACAVVLVDVVWLVCAAALFAALAYLVVRSPEWGWPVVAMCTGGAEMVLGYFVYEQFILGYLAIAEVPFNIMQVLVGVFGATLVLSYARRLRV